MPSPNKLAAALLALIAGAACDENPAIAVIPVRVEVSPATDTMLAGRLETPFTARVYNAFDDEIPDADLSWSGNAPLIASVDALTGAVAALEPGAVTVVARAGWVADSAALFVLADAPLRLPYDTILLAPGDTFTIPVEPAPGVPAGLIRFRGADDAVATVDSVTGRVTAVGAGAADFVVRADADSVSGLVEVLELGDTLGGAGHLGLSGAVAFSGTMPARARNHPTKDARTVFQLRLLDPAAHELDAILIDSLTGPATRVVEGITAALLGPDPVCYPPRSFLYYRRTSPSGLTALSVAGGTVTITSDSAIADGRIISGRLDVTLQRTDVAGPTGVIRARATFVVPLTTLDPCPT